MIILRIAVAVLWLVCGCWAAARSRGHFRGHYPSIAKDPKWQRGDRAVSLFLLLTGPFGVMALISVYRGEDYPMCWPWTPRFWSLKP